MMKRLAVAVSSLAAIGAAHAMPDIGAPAPDFEGATTSGETVTLEQFRGQKVILEWTNDGCPFVVKHYETGNMQATQAVANEAGVVWLTILSSAPGTQGHLAPEAADALTAERGATPDYTLIDAAGTIGRLYAARTTPQMVIIDEEGVLRYDGAIDDKPSADHATVDGARNYVLEALSALAAGEEIAEARTKPYGCSVKYAS